jgi:putative transport protein
MLKTRIRLFAVIISLFFIGAVADAVMPATTAGTPPVVHQVVQPDYRVHIKFLDEIFGNQIIALFAMIALGLYFGKIKIKGLSLGSSGVLFVALLFGYLGYSIPNGIGTIGCVLFVFCLGITAGPKFFAAFAAKGADLAKLAVIAVLSGAATTYLLAKIFHIPTPLASGLFAGAMTSTPGLAAAMEASKTDTALVSIGFGLAYPFGVISIVLFIQLVPKLLGLDLTQEAEKRNAELPVNSITRVAIKITNPGLSGKTIIEQQDFLDQMNCHLPRELNNGKLISVDKNSRLEIGKIFLAVGHSDKLKHIIEHFGEEAEIDAIMDADNERMQIAVTSQEFAEKTLQEIGPLDNFNVTISRITRQDMTFVPAMNNRLEYGDLLTVVGTAADLHSFAQKAGNKHKQLHSTDIISLAVGIAAGVLLGKMPLQLPGIKAFYLGMAGGPLFLALIMGYFKRIGSLTTRIPMASKMLLMDLGLLFFLAGAGVKAGSKIVPIFMEHGITLLLAAVIIKLVPMILVFLAANKLFKMNILETLGGMCGGMTSTPALGTITARVDSEIPVTCYVAAYPVALILMTIIMQFLVTLLAG